MANIALNKPSGGQLILSPEDGTSTETVTIPKHGVGDSGSTVQTVMVGSSAYVAASTGVAPAPLVSVMTASITPKYSNSKILVEFIGSGMVDGDGGDTLVGVILRDSTVISRRSRLGYFDYTSWTQGVFSMSDIDFPTTTSSVTYEIQLGFEGGQGWRIGDTDISNHDNAGNQYSLKLTEVRA